MNFRPVSAVTFRRFQPHSFRKARPVGRLSRRRVEYSRPAVLIMLRQELLTSTGPESHIFSTDPADSEKIGTIAPPWRWWIPRMGVDNVLFLQRLLLHYGIYRRYPLRPWPAFKNAWRIAFR